ncbi:MAG: A/G-specific adenine glycosylase [Dehalococcoidia bacterium]|nr:A/G-specific adenine glycosylase [Dehalococcoidia bacterium]
MLQQTQVERVAPKYLEFLARFPTLEALARATPAEVIRAWRPLGYNLRAVRLHLLAVEVVQRRQGVLPQDPTALRLLKGIGPYTAAAVACFAFGQDLPVIDTNVRRVLGRLFHGVAQVKERDLQATAREVLPTDQSAAWNQALMDLGATLCTSQRPHCPLCPVSGDCKAAPLFLQGEGRVAEAPEQYRAAPPPFKGSRRYYRGRIVDHLRTLDPGATVDLLALGQALLPDFQAQDLPWLDELLERLAQEGLVRLHRSSPQDGLPQAVGLPE